MHVSNFRVLKWTQNDVDEPNNKTFQSLFSRWATDPALQSVQASCGAQSASYPTDIDSPVPKDKVSGAWSSPFSAIYYRGYKCLEQHLLSAVRLQGLVLEWIQGHLYLYGVPITTTDWPCQTAVFYDDLVIPSDRKLKEYRWRGLIKLELRERFKLETKKRHILYGFHFSPARPSANSMKMNNDKQ